MSNPESKGVTEGGWPIVSTLLAMLPTVIAGAAGTLWLYLAGLIAKEGQTWTFQSKLVLQVAGLTALVFLYLLVLYLRLWLRSRTKIRFGILWDIHKNPICAKCRGPLGKATGSSLQCPACNIEYEVWDDFKQPFYIWDVVSRVRKGKPFDEKEA